MNQVFGINYLGHEISGAKHGVQLVIYNKRIARVWMLDTSKPVVLCLLPVTMSHQTT